MLQRIFEAFWLSRASKKAQQGDVAGADAALRRIGQPRNNRSLIAVLRAHVDVVNGRHDEAAVQIAEARRRLANSDSENAKFIRLYCDNLECVITGDVALYNKTATALQRSPKCKAKKFVVIVAPASEQALQEIRDLHISRAIH
jgi:hypothetical protein